MRHGHEMLWFSRWSFSESELPPSYNVKFEIRCTQLISYEINILNKVHCAVVCCAVLRCAVLRFTLLASGGVNSYFIIDFPIFP